MEGSLINYSPGANINGNFSIGTSASFVCTTTGEGLIGASMITCLTRLGATNGIGAWSRTPSCDREFLSIDVTLSVLS